MEKKVKHGKFEKENKQKMRKSNLLFRIQFLRLLLLLLRLRLLLS